MTSATIFTVFSEAADSAGRRTAITTSDSSITFDQLRSEIRALASHLSSFEAGAAALLSEEPRRFLTAFFACAAAGRPAMVLDPALPASRIRDLAEQHHAALFLVDEKFAYLPEHCPSLVLNDRFAQLSGSLPAVGTEDEFYWGLTSGTTGAPKLFARSHRSWLKSFDAAEQIFSFPNGSQVLIPGPLSHSLFLYGAVHALCRGHTVIAPGAFRPDRAASAAGYATHIYVVPSMLGEMLNSDLSDASVRLIFCGGAKLSAELREICETQLPDADLVEFYGASETSFISFHSTKAPAATKSVGRAFPSVSVEIRGLDEKVVAQGMEGEIYVKSPMLFSHYVQGASCPEWFTAGDIGFADAQGFLHLTGRKNRIINSRALKIRPEPIEQALLELPGVLRAAVLDIPDTKRGSIAVAAIEFHSGKALARSALSQHCRIKLGAKQCPQRYYQAELLPTTPSGKIALARLREALIERRPGFHELR